MTKGIENFFLSNSFLDSMDPTEVHATFTAMRECDIARAPFSEFCITVAEDHVIRVQNVPPEGAKCPILPEYTMEFHYRNVVGNLGDEASSDMIDLRVTSWHGRRSLDYAIAADKAMAVGEISRDEGEGLKSGIQKLGVGLLPLLVVSLATKGVSKVRERNKLAALGIGKKRPSAKHSYTTTISVGRVAEGEDEIEHTGRTVRPHLRRGHVRQQHYGPGREFVKKVFIEAVFVNSDKEFVSFRDRYNVSLTAPTKEESVA